MTASVDDDSRYNDASNRELCHLIAQRIVDHPQNRITFADYMDLALYHPQQGYYATNQAQIGAGGDFFTSPHLARDFGELLAVQFAQMWEVLDHPDPFTLVEMGAGQGLLVQDVVRYLHRHHFECFEALEYIVIEASGALVDEQQRRFQSLTQRWPQLHWRSWDDLAPESLVGCCFSNELVDAFPVHQLVWRDGVLQEVYVTLGGDRPYPSFAEVLGDLSTPELSEFFALNGVPLPSSSYPQGYRTEVNLAALTWMKTVASRLQRGYVLTIDYGYPAHRYYSPARSEGTLQCYYQHTHHNNPYLHVGHQDITTHVDFTALERQGERCGLTSLAFTQQGLFLMALGLGDRIAALSYPVDGDAPSLNELLRRREALHSLINPMGLGNFGVLLQGKGLSDRQQNNVLKGFTVPPL